MAKQPQKPRGLGRGLSALMADVPGNSDGAETISRADTELPIENVYPNPNQPRKTFSDSDLNELSLSIKENGIIQPLIVRADPKVSGKHQIVAGERRWRAAQVAGIHTVPVIIRDLTDLEVLELAIIENVQRADLNTVEEALGYRQLMDAFGHTQEEISRAMGKSRSHIANLLRLLNLPEPVLDYLRAGTLSAGHARALIMSPDPLSSANEVISKGLNVRQTENLIAKAKSSSTEGKGKTNGSPIQKDADTKALEADLSAHLKMKVTISHDKNQEGGKMTINYKDLDKLDDLCRLLSGY